MEALFLKLVNMSINASWLVLAVLIARICLKNAPKSIRCILWGFVGLRLVFPFSIESALSLIPSKETLPQEFLYAAAPQLDSGIPMVNQVLNPVIAESLAPAPLTSANPTQILSSIFSLVWILGMVLMAGYALISYLLVRRKVRLSIPLDAGIRLCDGIGSPFILGLFRPRIYLPSDLDGNTMDMVLAHERAHLRRKDHWWKPIGFVLLSIYWFNPVMWLAYVLLCRDIELACDEKVIQALGEENKKAYSSALLQCSLPRHTIAACPLAFGEIGVKERVKSILNYKKPAFWILVIAVITCLILGVCFLTDPETTDSESWEKQCREAILSIQKMDTYHFQQESSFFGAYVLNNFASTQYYGSDGTQIKATYIPADNSTSGYMVANGAAYESISYDGTFSWMEYDRPDQETAVPWIRSFDFDAQDVEAIARAGNEDQYYIRLEIHEYLEELDMSAHSYYADFHFNGDGTLLKIEQKIHMEGNSPAIFLDMTHVWTLADTSAADIAKTMEHIQNGTAIFIRDGLQLEPDASVISMPYPDGVTKAWANGRNKSNSILISDITFVTYRSMDALEGAIYTAVMDRNAPDDWGTTAYLESHVVLSEVLACGENPFGETIGHCQVCVIAMIQQVESVDEQIQILSTKLIPVVIDFLENDNHEFTVLDYWQPKAGEDPITAIETKFPSIALDKAKAYLTNQENGDLEIHIEKQAPLYFDLLPRPSLEELLTALIQDKSQFYLSFYQESNAAGKQAFNAWNAANADAYAKKLLDYTYAEAEATHEEIWRNKDYYTLYVENEEWYITFTDKHVLLWYRNKVTAYQAEPKDAETIPIYAMISNWYEEAEQQS